MKRPNGSGSITKLKGKRRKPYQIRITVGWSIDEQNGKAKQKLTTIGYAETKKEAFEILAEYKNNLDNIINNNVNSKLSNHTVVKITFKEVYERWSESKYPYISKSNVNGYKASYKLCESLYDKNFADLRYADLQGVVDKCGKNYPTLRKLKVLFNHLYDFALKSDICSKDYSEYVDIVKYKDKNQNEQNREKFSAKEVEKLWTMKDDKIYATILMLIYSGCRVSELLDLKKENVHIEEQYFDVIASKTKNGIRKVPIADKVLQFYKDWFNCYPNCEYLIATNEGKHFTYRNYLDSYYNPALENLNISHTPHCCRHTCISMLAMAKVDQTTIKKIVGHAGAMTLTEKVYTHLDVKTLIDAINKI